MSTPLLTPTPLAAPSGPSAVETSLSTPAAAYCLDGEVQAIVTNAPGGPDQPCRVELWLSKDGGTSYVRSQMRWTSTGAGATYRVSFALGRFAEADRLTDWTHFYLRFAGNRQDANPVAGAVTVSAFADGATWDVGGGGGAGTVTGVAVASSNGLAGSSDGNPATPTLSLGTTVTGLLQGNGAAISAVSIGAGLSYAGGTLSATGGAGTVTAVATGTGLTGGTITTTGTIAIAAGGVGTTQLADGGVTNAKLANSTANTLAGYNNLGAFSDVAIGPGLTLSGGTIQTISAGTVTSVSVAAANGLAGTSDGNATTPTLTLRTTVTGILQGNGTAISAITVGSGLSFAGGTLTATGTGGTVTSLSPGTGINLSPNPIIGTGTISQAPIPANTIAANNTGSPAVPSGVTTGLKIDQHYGGILFPAPTLGAINLDLSQSDYFSVSLTGACTIGFANPAPSGMKQPFVLEIVPGGNTIIWAGVIWPGGTAPTPSSGAGKIDLYGFVRNSTTGKYYGSVIGQNY